MTPHAGARRILLPVPTLADYPQLVAQLDAKNGPIAPETLAKSSKRRLWWRCPAGPDHLWAVPVVRRTLGSGCPFCAGKAVSVTNALSKVAPAIARQWHPTLNGDLRPRDVVAGSGRAAWWKCPKGPDHVWRTQIFNRVHARTGCPLCSGLRATAARNLAVASPHLLAEWHPALNGDLRPEDVMPRSRRTIWWRCVHRHIWTASPRERATGLGCPYCSGRRVSPELSLAAKDRAVAKQWHPTKNAPLTPRDVMPASGLRVWWKCPKGLDHEWEAQVCSRKRGGCPFCAGRRVSATTSLAAVRPDLAAKWHPTKNGALTPHDVTPGAHVRAWWTCPKGPDHEWEGRVNTQKTRFGCPFCAGKRVSVTNSLAATEPKLAVEWHPTKNGTLTPHDVTRGTQRRVWWRCVFGHEWHRSPNARTSRGAGCPTCHKLRREQPAATTGRRRKPVRFAAYEGARRGPVRHMK
jgi:hypothetical protein